MRDQFIKYLTLSHDKYGLNYITEQISMINNYILGLSTIHYIIVHFLIR